MPLFSAQGTLGKKFDLRAARPAPVEFFTGGKGSPTGRTEKLSGRARRVLGLKFQILAIQILVVIFKFVRNNIFFYSVINYIHKRTAGFNFI